jgi:hypothetical protein
MQHTINEIKPDGSLEYLDMDDPEDDIWRAAVLEIISKRKGNVEEKGGPGSGFHGHVGIPGHQGGSQAGTHAWFRTSMPTREKCYKAFKEIYGMELDEFVNSAFETKYGNVTCKVNELRYIGAGEDESADFEFDDKTNGKYIRVLGYLTDTEADDVWTGNAGRFERWISLNPDDKVLGNVSFEIGANYQNNDIGVRAYEQEENAAMKAGFDYIALQANDAVGGYAWARMGFDFADKDIATAMGYQFTEYLSHSANADTVNRFDSIKTVHAWDIATFVKDNGYKIGKDFLLGKGWEGIKKLDPTSEGYKIGQAYYASHHK